MPFFACLIKWNTSSQVRNSNLSALLSLLRSVLSDDDSLCIVGACDSLNSESRCRDAHLERIEALAVMLS